MGPCSFFLGRAWEERWYKYLNGGYKEGRARLFSSAQSWDKRQVEYRRLHLSIRKCFVHFGTTELWNRLPRDILESPFLKRVTSHLDMVLGNWL